MREVGFTSTTIDTVRNPIREIFEQAITLEIHKRNIYINKACSDDPKLKAQVLELLSTHDELDTFDEKAFDDAMCDELSTPIKESLTNFDKILISNYKLIRHIGSGGMGDVFLAKRDNKNIDQNVAIKILKNTNSGSSNQKRFLQEQKILSQLEHPYIARFIDAGYTNNNHPYVVMEYVDGHSLLDAPINNYTFREKLSLFIKICESIIYIHQHLIIHKDIKPNNILINSHGDPKILDFGIAKIIDQNATINTTIALTPKYASPELILQQPLNVATDVYSLGLVLYEFLTGVHPKNLPHLNKKTHSQEFINPSQAVNFINESRLSQNTEKLDTSHLLKGDLDLIITKAIKNNVNDRYQSVEKFTNDLKSHLNHQPISLKKPNIPYLIKKLFLRHKLACILTSVLTTTVLLLLIFVINLNKNIKSQSLALIKQQGFTIEEKNKVESLSEALKLSFANADPTQSGDSDITADRILKELEILIKNKKWKNASSQLFLALSLNEIYQNLGQYQSAFNLLEPFIHQASQFEKIQIKNLYVNVVFNAIRINQQNNYLNLIDKIPETLKLNYDVLKLKGHLSIKNGKYDEAEHFFSEALKKITLQHPHYFDVCLGVAGSQSKQNKLNRSNNTIQTCKSINNNNNNDKTKLWQRSLAFKLMGDNYGYLGSYDESTKYYQKAIDIRSSILGKDHILVTDLFGGIGSNYSLQGRHDDAVKMHQIRLKKRLELYGEGDKRLFMTYHNISNAFYRSGEFTRSIENLMHVLHHIDPNDKGMHVNLSFIYQNLSRSYYELNQFDKAQYYSEETIKILKPFGQSYQSNRVNSQLMIASIALKQNRIGIAKDILEKTEQFILNQENQDLMDKYQELKSQLF